MSIYRLSTTLCFYRARHRSLCEPINSGNMDDTSFKDALQIYLTFLVAINVVVFMMIDRNALVGRRIMKRARSLTRSLAYYLCTCRCVRQEKSNLFLLATPNSHTDRLGPTMALHAKQFPINSRYAVERVVLPRGPRPCILFCMYTARASLYHRGTRAPLYRGGTPRVLPISARAPVSCEFNRVATAGKRSAQFNGREKQRARACEISRNAPANRPVYRPDRFFAFLSCFFRFSGTEKTNMYSSTEFRNSIARRPVKRGERDARGV